jgi:hypothetical protein
VTRRKSYALAIPITLAAALIGIACCVIPLLYAALGGAR